MGSSRYLQLPKKQTAYPDLENRQFFMSIIFGFSEPETAFTKPGFQPSWLAAGLNTYPRFPNLLILLWFSNQ